LKNAGLKRKNTYFDFGWGSLQRSPRPPSSILESFTSKEGRGGKGQGNGVEG